MSDERHRVVVVGGGFGGIRVTRVLSRADVDLVIVDRTNHHLFQPLLYQVAARAGSRCGGTAACPVTRRSSPSGTWSG